MKVLLMGTHIDGLELPEGQVRSPHEHEWRVNSIKSELDPHGRPYCIHCHGMPMWYDLEEVEYEDSHISVKCGLRIIVERDV